MKVLILSGTLCAAVFAAVYLTLGGTSPGRDDGHTFDREAEIASLREAVAELEAEREGLRGAIADLQARQAAAAETPPLPRAADEADAPKGGGPGGPDADGAAAVAEGDDPHGGEAPADDFSLEDAIDALFDPALDWDGRQPVWNELVARGLVDEGVAAFEEQARANPQDPDAHAALGHAYIQKLMTVGDMEKGVWMMKADRSYDQALELDDHHWEARFCKAVCYSVAPPLLGLQARAIEQFEILRGQQECGEPQDHFAQTYVFLGNLHSSQGKSARAQAVWQAGLALFPDNAELRERVPTAGGE